MVNAQCEAVGNAPFEAVNTRLHGAQVIGFGLPPARIVASLLHLAGFEVVAGVVLVGDGNGADIQCLHCLKEIRSIESEHLQYTGLGQVVTVFGATLALRQPDGFSLSAQVVNVVGEGLGILHLLVQRPVAYHDEATQEAHDGLYPPFSKEVVADAYVRADKIAHAQEHRQPRGVHADITVVGQEASAVLDVLLYLFAVAQVG